LNLMPAAECVEGECGMEEIERIEGSSQYLATLLRKRPDFVDWLWTGKNLYRRYPLAELYEDLHDKAMRAATFESLLLSFREFKQLHFLRIGGRDLLGKSDLAETTSQLSDLACVALQVGLETLYAHPEWWVGEGETRAWSEVIDHHGLVIMGMGKLGGNELNYVSDVDLLFLFAPKDETADEFLQDPVLLSRLCQWISRLMADSAEGDRVFQVDLRLRPQGKDGPLVPSVASASDYYLNAGRAWERQVLLKARPAAGDRSLGRAFLQEVHPFVFRRFLDFQALDELKAMRDRILAEAVRPRSGWQQFDVKLGVGGIREIEFLVQSLQLIYGGRHPELDEPNTLRCLARLGDLRLLPASTVRELTECYTFLRRVEHWVQLDQNRQTQKLPQSGEALARLACALGFQQGEAELHAKLDECCAAVHRHFLELFHSGEGDGSPQATKAGTGEPNVEPGGYSDPALLLPAESLSQLRDVLGAYPASFQQTVMSGLHQRASGKDAGSAERMLARLLRYFGQVRKRPGLMGVFRSCDSWVGGFLHGLMHSELFSSLLAQNPSLVEGIATESGICPNGEEWEERSERLLATIKDYESGLEWIRRLKNERAMQLVLADLGGYVDHETLERELTSLADFVIRKTYGRVLENLRLDPRPPLVVLGMGKLGSGEMGYLSDLDLVFVYDPPADESEDHIPADVIRFIQRFMRMLSTPLQEGPGYAVDARLRPTGNYGPLIVTRRTWLEYYSDQADIWEMQALLRVRCIVGDTRLGTWIEEKARELCYQERDPYEVWQRLCHLRGRMQRERSEEKGDDIDFKLGVGGLADLEFLVQGLLLSQGHRNAALRIPSVRSALKEVLDTIPDLGQKPEDVQKAFEALRSLEHRVRLHTNLSSSRLGPEQFTSLKAAGLWPPFRGGSFIEDWQDLLRLRRRVREILHQFCPDL
jgi:[glutamine synthetase] adenylyltransferase / [glutamine synthetase]-adenylyl-L-tyrosine phosphorylase